MKPADRPPMLVWRCGCGDDPITIDNERRDLCYDCGMMRRRLEIMRGPVEPN